MSSDPEIRRIAKLDVPGDAGLLYRLIYAARCAFIIHTSDMEAPDSYPAFHLLEDFRMLWPQVEAVDWRQRLPPERAATLVAAIVRMRDLMTLVSLEEGDNRPVADRTPIFELSHDVLRTVMDAAAIIEYTPPQPSTSEPQIDRLVMGEDGTRIMAIASDRKRSANDRMIDIIAIDRLWLGKDSVEWAELLGVTDQAIRKTKTWDMIQKGRAAE